MKLVCKELSEDCWELILNRLAIDDFNSLQSPSLVCKQFLSITDQIRLKLEASNRLFYSHNCEGLFRALQRFRNLQEIELREPFSGGKADVNYLLRRIASSGTPFLDLVAYGDHDRLICSIATAGNQLEKIILYNDSGLSLHGLSTFFCVCASLTHLMLCSIDILTDNSMRDLCRYLPNLVSIKFYQCSYLTTATFFILAKECPVLSEIEMPLINLHVEDNFDMDLERNYRIKSLNFRYVDVDDEFLRKIGVVCPNLQNLDVSGLYPLTEGIEKILKCCSQIKHLTVDRTREIVNLLEQFKTRCIKIEHLF